MRVRSKRLLGVTGAAALAMALVPAVPGSAGHGGAIELDVDLREPATAETGVEDLVSDNVEILVSAAPTDAALEDTEIAVDLPAAFTFVSAEGTDSRGDAIDCTARADAPDVLCDVGDLSSEVQLTLTADSTARAASTVTTYAYVSWDGLPAVSTSDTAVLADTTIRAEDASAGTADGQVSVALVNTGDAIPAENVTAEIRLPDPTNQNVEATITNSPDATCERLDQSGGHIICQDIVVAPTGPLDGALVGNEPTITITGLDNDESILLEAKGDLTSRTAIGYNVDGSVDEAAHAMHTPATRTTQAALQPVRSGTAGLGVILNRQAIDVPATEFTPVFGQANWSLDDDQDAGAVRTEWVEGDVRYEFEASTFRNIQPELDYFQDGGVNFDTHQHGATFRPNGPGNVPDLFVQALVYSVGTLTVHDGSTEETFENVAMHMMFRQLAKPEADVEAFQRWADKGPKPAPSETIDYDFSEDGPTPPLPYDLNLVEVLFANTPDGQGGCAANGIAGTDCSTALGTFVRFMSFADVRDAAGFNPAGIDLPTTNPARTMTQRIDSVDTATLATTGDAVNTAVYAGLDASAEIFATQGQPGDPRTGAAHVVLSRDDVFADALAASGLAGPLGPVLFTTGGPDASLDPRVLAEIDRVLADGATVYVVGGPQAVSTAAEARIEQAGFNVIRLGGQDRLETAELIAAQVRQINPDATEQLLVRAYSNDPVNNPTRAWADSISGGAYAADQQIPVILTRTEDLSPAAERALDPASTTYVIGGESAVSASTANDAPNAQRIDGEDRFSTAIEVARQLFDRTAAANGDTYVLSPGRDTLGWAFGLAAAPYSALNDAPIMLRDRTGVPSSVNEYLQGLGYDQSTVGNALVSSSIPTDDEVANILELLAGR